MSKKSWNRKVDPTRDVQTKKKKQVFKRKHYKPMSKRDFENLMEEDYNN